MSTSARPPLPTPGRSIPSFAHQAAKASWTSVVVIIGLGIFANAGAPRIPLELLAFGIMCFGFVLGVISLFGIRKHDTKGILTPAIVGLILNGLLLFIFITNFLAARAKAQERAIRPATFVCVILSR